MPKARESYCNRSQQSWALTQQLVQTVDSMEKHQVCLKRTAAGHVEPGQPPDLLRLDEDTLQKVLEAAGPPALANAACACRDLRNASESEPLWQEFCTRRWLHPHKHLPEGAAWPVAGSARVLARLYVNF